MAFNSGYTAAVDDAETNVLVRFSDTTTVGVGVGGGVMVEVLLGVVSREPEWEGDVDQMGEALALVGVIDSVEVIGTLRDDDNEVVDVTLLS